MLSAMGFLSRLFGRGSAAPKEYRPAQIVHEAFDGAVRVFEVPKGKEWRRDEDAREADGYTVMALKYILRHGQYPRCSPRSTQIKEGFCATRDNRPTGAR